MAVTPVASNSLTNTDKGLDPSGSNSHHERTRAYTSEYDDERLSHV
ncbi:hypothetical protein [Arthrobacter sp. C152]